MMRNLLFATVIFCFLTNTAYADVCSSQLNLVSNCGFETGTLANWSLAGIQSSPAYQGIAYGVDAADAHSGTYGAYLGGYGGYISLFQSFATTAGATYEISYYLAQAPATPPPYTSGFSAVFDGMTLFAGGNAPLLPFRQYSFTAKATGNFSTLAFGARDDTGYFSLDDISVVPAPEPSTYMVLALLLCWFVSRARRLRCR